MSKYEHLDLTKLLADWPCTSGQVNVRVITGRDDRPKLQLRIELGILQMEIEGRPDGRQPEGFTTYLDYQKDRMQRYLQQSGTSAGFVLSPDECRQLREEAIQFYHRYVGLFAMGDYTSVIRDTQHNLEVFNLARDHAASEDDREVLERFRPAVITMRSRAEAEMALKEQDVKTAVKALNRGLEEMKTLFEEAGAPEQYEYANEVMLLRGMRDTLVPRLPSSQRVELEERLQAALDAENYELAAILRDELRLLD